MDAHSAINKSTARYWGLILSRRDSKRLPAKAQRPLCGRPLIHYTFQAAQQAPTLEHRYIYSNDPTILSLAEEEGIAVPPFPRPDTLSNDSTTSAETIRHFLAEMQRVSGVTLPDYIVLLQPTSPCRTSKDIEEAISSFCQSNADTLVSLSSPSKPIHWACQVDNDGFLTSDAIAEDAWLLPNGAIYIFPVKEFLEENTILFGKTLGFVMPPERSIDVDTDSDLSLAEYHLSKSTEVRPVRLLQPAPPTQHSARTAY